MENCKHTEEMWERKEKASLFKLVQNQERFRFTLENNKIHVQLNKFRYLVFPFLIFSQKFTLAHTQQHFRSILFRNDEC